MRNWTLFTFTALAGGAMAAAVPAALPANIFKRVVTPDGTCGGSNGYTCPTASFRCCSQWGWCGDSSEHCGTGCQSAFGACTGSGSPPTTTTTTTPTPPNPTGISLPRSRPGVLPYGSWITTCTRPGFVALTFDDGPHIYTTQLLDLLKANGVVATFFVNGANWGDPITTASKVAILKRMIADGHQIASHTWSHPDLSTLSEAQIISQMTQLETAFIAAIGKFPTYMRPPYFSCGSLCLNTMARLGYHTINADIDTLDWMYNTPSTIGTSRSIFANAINSASPSNRGFITLMHDVHQTTVTNLVQYTIDTLKARGFRATTVGWCLDDHSSNWYRTTQ